MHQLGAKDFRGRSGTIINAILTADWEKIAMSTITEILARARGRPIYLIHGALDWMFPVGVARAGCEALEAAGARVTYREIEDLSHTYPRDENRLILEWLLAEPAATDADEGPTAFA